MITHDAVDTVGCGYLTEIGKEGEYLIGTYVDKVAGEDYQVGLLFVYYPDQFLYKAWVPLVGSEVKVAQLQNAIAIERQG